MSVQWTLVASFLYAEIVLVILLLLPFITPRTWQRLFKSKFLNSLANQANIYFMVFVVILVLLFVDSIREMKKYSFEREYEHEHGRHIDAELNHSMKLFRAQRNFYIAGFALFLCLVIRRLVTLLTAQASLELQNQAAMKQAKSASEAAEKLMKGGASTSRGGDRSEDDNEGNQKLELQEKKLRELREALSEAKEEVNRLKIDNDSMKSQAKNVSQEYDRLMREHTKLQELYDRAKGSESKKDS